MLFAKPVGPTTAPSGPDPAPVLLSARQAKEKGLLTSGTYGQPSSISLLSALLTQSWASRYRQRTASCGSSLYVLTWKARVTPLGRLMPAQRASARPTSGSGSTGWPTARSTDGCNNARTLQGAENEAKRKSWNND